MAPTFQLTRAQRVVCALLLLPLVALLAWLAADTVRDIVRWRDSSSWVAVRGTVEASGIRGCGRGGYMATVHYRYAEARTGDRFVFGETPCGDREEARETARGYPRGAPVTVYVDPDDPAQSVLQRSVAGRTWVGLALLLFTIVLLLVFAAAWLFGTREP